MLNHILKTKQEPVKNNANKSNYIIRRRISALLSEAAKKPLTIVCAGAGYGKTCAVSDFVRESKNQIVWVQLSEHDNFSLRFWENYTQAFDQVDKSLTNELRELDFPNSEEKQNRHLDKLKSEMANQNYIMVLNDIHFITVFLVLVFLEKSKHNPPENI